MKHIFEKPFEFEGKKYEEIEMNLESLKGADISAVKKQYSAMGLFSPLPTTDSDFCALIAARQAKLPLEFFTELPAREYCLVTQKVSNFLNCSV